MKKLFDSKFLIISALSIITLILLIVFSFFLFDRDEAKFVKSGYIINPLSATSEKYFFESGTGYRENLSSMVVFNDVDSNEAKVLRDSFVHYDDGSLSLLKNGAILDVDSIHDNLAIFYNISNSSIIEKDNNGYHIESINGNINLKNFIVRISDKKYLVAGDVKLSYDGNPSSVNGDYFEIVYVEEGIVNIENKNFKYELSAEGTKVVVGDYTIDLGTKVLSYRDNDVMSITAITIDGNENVEIIPKKEEPSSSSNNGAGGNSQEERPADNSSPDNNPASSGNDISSSSGESGSSSGNGGNGGSSGGSSITNAPRVSLKDAKINSTSVEVVFDIENKEDNDNYMLQVINADTGNTIDITAEVLSDVPIEVNLLTPSTKYLFTVVNRETKEQYFQKIFKTNSLGINLEKSYAKSDSLTYKLTVGSDTQVSDAVLTLYKFDEELGENVETGKKIRLSEIPKEENQEVYYLLFDELESDSIYTAVLDNFALQSVNFRDVYNISVTSLTLKKTPQFPSENSQLMSITEGETANDFKLYIGDIVDSDNAITSYTYYVYDTNETIDEDDDELALSPITKDNASPITVNLGRKNNELREDTNYYYKAVIEYFDNEKYVEYETINSSYFIKTGKPTITVIPNGDSDADKITHNQIAAKIFLNDRGCEVKLADRPGVNCNGDNIVRIRVTKINNSFGENDSEEYKEVVVDRFYFEGESVFYPLVMGDLESGTTYAINVYTYDEDGALVKIPHASDSTKTITTLTLADFQMHWGTPDSSKEQVIKIDAMLEGIVREDALSIEDSVSKISRIAISLYSGDVRDTISLSQPIATELINSNIKSLFFDESYLITSNETFHLSKTDLENLNTDHKVSKQYTIVVNAYYGSSNEISLINKAYVFNVPITVREDNISKPEISVNTIRNSQVNDFFDKVGTETIVGYLVHGIFVNDNRITVKNAVFKVYDQDNNPVKFYIKKNGNIDILNPVNEIKYTDINRIEEDFEIYMDYGIDYNSHDDIMRRGNKYTVGYYLEVLDRETGEIVKYPSVEEGNWPSSHGVYAVVEPSKETPSMKMYISSSTANSVKYKYFIKDADNAIYKSSEDSNYNLYYIINNDIVHNVNLLSSNDSNNKFEGEFTISNLGDNDIYSLYYKLNILKSGNIDDDIITLNDSKIKDLKFDGYVDSSLYNFKYKLINQPGGNRVAIVILSDDIILNNTLDYKITFRDSVLKNGNVNEKEYAVSKLLPCDDTYDISGNRCYFMDYATLKALGMKSNASTNEIHDITVSITANYDTGLMGYDSTFDNYIFKEISRADTSARYIVLDANGNIAEWDRSGNVLAGYYNYTKKVNASTGIITSIDLENKETNVKNKNIGLVLKNYGYIRESTLDGEAIVPHEIKIENMPGEDNTFSFSSITPKASPSVTIPFLSGAGISLKVSGIDISDFVKEDNKYYLYIETWENIADVGNFDKVARPKVPVIVDSNTSNLIEGIRITGLHSYSNVHPAYYYRIYANMYVNNHEEYVQLNDANSVEPIKKNYYTFQTRGAANILTKDSIKLNVDDSGNDVTVDYGERNFTTTFNLEPYAGGYEMDYTMEYYLCYDDGSVCDIDHNIKKREIPYESMSTSIKDTFNAYEDDFIYGVKYKLYANAKFSVYERNDNGDFVTSEESLWLKKPITAGNYLHDIRDLKEPTFTILREAKYINGEYVVDFDINVRDDDAVLQSTDTPNDGSVGIYTLALTRGNDVVGTLQVTGDNGFTNLNISGYENYSKYPFAANIVNNKIRIVVGNDVPNTEYKMQAFGKAYTNNLNTDGEKLHDVASRRYTVYTSNANSIALGAIKYYATKKSIRAIFTGGSNLVNNINRLNYTIIDQDNGIEYNSPIEDYVIGSGQGHYFEYEGEEYMLTLLGGMDNSINQLFSVTMRLYDRDNNLYDIPTDDDVRYIADKQN